MNREDFIDELASSISGLFHLRGRDAVLDIARECARARSQLEDKEADALAPKLPFSPS